jgi:hypothetical protein
VLDIDRDLGFRCGGGLGWEEDVLDTSGWGETMGALTVADWARGGDGEWAACAPPSVKVEEVEPVLEWPEDQDSVLQTTRAGTPYLSPPLSKSIRPFVHSLYSLFFIGWSEFDDGDLALAALMLADMQGEGLADGEQLMIDRVLAADRDGMTLEWVNVVRVVVQDLE